MPGTSRSRRDLAGEHGGPDDAGVVPELGCHDPHRLPPGDPEDVRGHRVPSRTDQQLAVPGRGPAADHDHLGIEDVDDVRQADPEEAADLAEDVARERVALDRRFADELSGDRVEVAAGTGEQIRPGAAFDALPRETPDRVAGRDRLPAAAVAAAAHGAVGIDHHVPELRADTVMPAVDVAVDDDAAADPGTDGDHDLISGPAPGAVDRLRQRRDVRVVVDDRRQAEFFGEPVADGYVTVREVRCAEDHAGVRIDEAGRTDPDRHDAGSRLAELAGNG